MDDMTEFRLTYDGPALENHEMDPRELAPALLAMADLLEASARVLYGDRAKISVNVKGSFETGSFNIDFVAGVQWLKSIRDIFAGPETTAIANATAILGALGIIGKRGLLPLLKWLRSRSITRIETIDPESGSSKVRIYVEDEFYDVEKGTVDLLRDVGVRKATEQVLAPLEKPGISVVALGQGVTVNVTVQDTERAAFVAPQAQEELIIDDIRDMAFSIVSLAFKEDNKWRLSDGASTISAIISDTTFLHAVDDNIASFSKGDSLVCRVRVRQWQTAHGTRTEYEVVEVKKHLRAVRQIQLPWGATTER
ncbi:hypothetical protein [Luteibacter sp.]|jgi:hypothetical protein|uniref:hypothetical protein n=1 Tax=Luteibacter sp. TaxID=1886636 RepID=UPI002F3FC9E6